MAAEKNTEKIILEENIMGNNREEAIRLTREKVIIHEMINFDKKPENPVKISIVVPVCNVEQYLRECIGLPLELSVASYVG